MYNIFVFHNRMLQKKEVSILARACYTERID